MMPGNTALEMSKTFLLLHMYPEADHLLQVNQRIDPNDHHLMQLNVLMLQQEYDSAASFLQTQDQFIPGHLVKDYENLISGSNNLTDKKPWLALTMSTIVPGTGRFYTGEWKDGAFSLAVVGLSAWQAYRQFNRGGPANILGWISAGFGFAFYIGNIYGSYHSAKKINTRSREKHYYQVEDLVHSTF